MPQRIFCGKCKTVFYEGDEVIPPIDILIRYNSTCPKCGKRMDFLENDIAITLLESNVKSNAPLSISIS